ncbi:glycosyltransferase family 4 protein [Schinkia azotoformans]|uniref:Group 1 glycosyl transferase n=1 Tax=Schinkia azotoformans LMG 9581 TaxID=1131731 RepID=K6CR80_SCHAZ|nr:glycosyltransferase family 4 protein [Schinkia azotoformans]EKN62762.1 group 1 glycosyl transferase [Schinkia azotoformans LMG 9581]MEC1639138.1 glycosyltransferase family 4 protein [Schinkia azotoformans]MEC1945726.1 glycosyltransferase family 4 protein [Schinkia azotoformans]
MKIVHVVIGNSYTDGWAYQENLLPEAHYRLGHKVTVIASTENSLEKEKIYTSGEVYNINGVKIIRLKPDKQFLNARFSIHSNLYNSVVQENADLIFIHGLNFLSLSIVKKIKESNPKCIIFADTHADQFNSILRYKLVNEFLIHKGIWKFVIQSNISYIDKVYYTSSATKSFAETMYNIPSSKLTFLPMGGDVTSRKIENKIEIKKKVREKYKIMENDFLLVSGGRFDRRKNIDKLLSAVKNIDNSNLKVLVFGKFQDEAYEKEVNEIIGSDKRVKFIGWLSSEETTDIFLSADLGVFPGTQSIIWRNAVSCGLPLICRYTMGAEQIDVNGNAIHMFTDDVWAWTQMLENVITIPEFLEKLRARTLEYGVPFFDNERIAQSIMDDSIKIRNTEKI